MKILVAVKRVIDAYVKIRVKPNGEGVETAHVKMAMNPFDEIAVEEALRMREKQWASEVVLVSVGEETSQETLRHGLALGADRAILVRTARHQCSLNIATILQQIVKQEEPALILMGKQSIDGDNNQTAQMLAAKLNWPQATFASSIEIKDKHVCVVRETDTGLETLEATLPAVVSTDLRLNEPRYVSLPNIMKAKSKPLSIVDLDSLHLDLKPHIEVLSVKAPPAREAGILVDSVDVLLDKLQQTIQIR